MSVTQILPKILIGFVIVYTDKSGSIGGTLSHPKSGNGEDIGQTNNNLSSMTEREREQTFLKI